MRAQTTSTAKLWRRCANPNVIHYTGHMIAPTALPAVSPLRRRRKSPRPFEYQLDRQNVGYGYGSLACGADTLIVEVLLQREGRVGVVLPFETASFVEKFRRQWRRRNGGIDFEEVSQDRSGSSTPLKANMSETPKSLPTPPTLRWDLRCCGRSSSGRKPSSWRCGTVSKPAGQAGQPPPTFEHGKALACAR